MCVRLEGLKTSPENNVRGLESFYFSEFKTNKNRAAPPFGSCIYSSMS